MKQGISLFSFTDSTDVRWMFEHAKKAGYDGVEPVMSESGYLNPATPEKDILAMRRMAEDIGLEIPSVGVWSLWENNLVSDNPAIRGKGLRHCRKANRSRASAGGGHHSGCAGLCGLFFCIKAGEDSLRCGLCPQSGGLGKKLAPQAAAAKVAIGIENVWNRFLLSPLETARFLDEIGSPWVGMYLDVGNVVYLGYPEQWVEAFGKSHQEAAYVRLLGFDQAGIGAL